MKDRTEVKSLIKALCGIDGAYDLMAKKIGIKPNLVWLFYILDDGNVHTQKQICQEWMFPKTTINTLIKECEADGRIHLQTISGRKRELQICLTAAGREYARRHLDVIYEAEAEAMAETLKTCSPQFIADFVSFSENLKTALEKRSNPGKDQFP